MIHQFGFFLAEENFPEHRQQIDGRQHHPNRGEAINHDPEGQGVSLVRCEAGEHHELAHKTAHARQCQRRQCADSPEREHDAHLLAHATHLIELQGVGAVIGGPHEEEEAGSDQAMADHLKHRAARAEIAEAADADEHKTHMADRAVGDFAFEIPLRERGEGGIDDVDHTQHHQQGCELGMSFGKELSVESHQRIAPHLQQDSCQEHVHGGRGFSMGVRKPGVKRHDRQFDAECDQESCVAEQLEPCSEPFLGQHAVFEIRSPPAEEAHGKGRQQDEQRTAGCVEDELGRGVLTLFSTPDRQQEIDG